MDLIFQQLTELKNDQSQKCDNHRCFYQVCETFRQDKPIIYTLLSCSVSFGVFYPFKMRGQNRSTYSKVSCEHKKFENYCSNINVNEEGTTLNCILLEIMLSPLHLTELHSTTSHDDRMPPHLRWYRSHQFKCSCTLISQRAAKQVLNNCCKGTRWKFKG